MRIGLFGGAFDPITINHIDIANKLIELDIVDKVVIIPTYFSINGKNLTDGIHRLNMCNLVSNNNIIVSDYEINNKIISTFHEIVSYLMIFYENCKCFFIIGLDNALNVEKWKDYEKNITLLPFIIIPRDNNNDNHNCDYVDKWFNKEPHIYLNNHSIKLDGSSTQAKHEYKYIGQSNLLNDKTLDYIKQNNLYN